MHKVQVIRPNGQKVMIEVDAPNQRDAINCAITQVVGGEGKMIDSSSPSKTAAMYPEYTARIN